MKKNFLAPHIRVSAVKTTDILTTSFIEVGDSRNDGETYDDAAAQSRNVANPRPLAH